MSSFSILAIVVLLIGFVVFLTNQSAYQQCQTVLTSIGQVFDQSLAARCHNAQMLHTGSIGIMGLGGVLLLVSLFPQKPQKG